MDTKELTPVEHAKSCIDNHISFVLHGGAGSGKTETLKDLLQYMSKMHPTAKVACITHTNIAAEEIKERIGNSCPVSTIHAFLYDLIKRYKKNIKSVIHELFVLPLMVREPLVQGMSETDYKKAEHQRYKKTYGEYADRLYSLSKQTCDKVAGKRDYDKAPETYNANLNQKISDLNEIIIRTIHNFDFSKIEYNKTKFNSFKDVSYGHDGLLDIVHLLFCRYPVLKKIISDKYDYIFIDEYQDTRASVVEDFIIITQEVPKFTICLFGDSMQSIYGDGIGNVDNYTEAQILSSIPKQDNFRCSYEVLDLINTLRLDNIKQEVALAKDSTGQLETEDKRHGSVSILYAIYNQKPTPRSQPEEKEAYLNAVESLIAKARKYDSNAKILLLTNKAIAKKEGFPALYKVFDDRYTEIADRMDEYLKRLQITDLCELCCNYLAHNYNTIIKFIKQSGYIIQRVEDKVRLKELFDELLSKRYSLSNALDFAFEKKLLEKSETYTNLRLNNDRYLAELGNDQCYQMFKKHYESGENTFTRINESLLFSSEEQFDDYENRYKKERFINQILSDSINFSEAINYYKYVNENSMNITMHKTKGSSIDSVIVVMEEYFWTSEYDFSLLYSGDITKPKKKENSQKLIYVACSRARKNLICIKLITSEEEALFCKRFPYAQRI